MDRVRQLWRESKLPVPTVLLGYHNGKYYVTTSDSSTICFFASKAGKIYVAVKRKCRIQVVDGESIYVIDEPDALQVISCPSKPLPNEDRFVVDVLFKDPILAAGLFKSL